MSREVRNRIIFAMVRRCRPRRSSPSSFRAGPVTVTVSLGQVQK